MFRRMSHWLTIILLGWLCASDPVWSAAQDSEESTARVEDYLVSLRLDSILIEQLQQRLDDTTDRTSQIKIAKRLSELCAKKVFSGRHDQLENQYQRIVKIARDFPEIETPDLKMTILHSEYVDAERDVIQWIEASRPDEERAELRKRFQDVGFRLKRQLNTLENTIFEGSDARLYAQASYLYGWTSYYIGLLDKPNRRSWMERSNVSFRDFLEIDSKRPVTELSLQWFELQSPWHARAQIGLAMCLRALGESEQSDFCFRVLEQLEPDQQVKHNLDVWRMNSFVYLEQMDKALAFLQTRVEDNAQDREARTRLWVAAIDAASASDQGPYSKTGVAFLRFGLRGLATDMNAPVLKELVERDQIDLRGDDFLLAWCRGYLRFFQGEESQTRADFVAAKKELTWAVHAATASTDSTDLAKCRFLLGWIEFQLQEMESAKLLLQQAIPELVQTNNELAGEAQWLVVRSLQVLAESDPRYVNEAFEAMDKLTRSFPNSKYVRRVEFEKLLMEVSKFPPREAMRRLKKIQKGDPNYSDAVFQQVQLQYQIWQERFREGDLRKGVALEQLLEMDRSFHQLYPLPPTLQRTRTVLLSIDALIRTGGEQDLARAKTRIKVADGLAKNLDPLSSLSTELRYFHFQLARAAGDFDSMQRNADWFFEQLPESEYCRSVLVAMAQLVKQRYDALDSPSDEDLGQLVVAFDRLVQLLGSRPAELRSSQNARVAASRLAEYLLKQGVDERAGELAENLLEAFPDRRDLLLLSARAKMKLENYEGALEHWRKIASGVEPGSEDWYESKLGIVRCLAMKKPSSMSAAKAVFEQTVRLSGTVPPQWSNSFNELAKQLGLSLEALTSGGKK